MTEGFPLESTNATTDAAEARAQETLRRQFRDASRGHGRAGTAEMPDGPYMSMDDAAAVYACLATAAAASGAGVREDDIPQYAPDDISHLEGIASYLDGYARNKGRAGLPASKALFEEIAKRLRQLDALLLAASVAAPTEQQRDDFATIGRRVQDVQIQSVREAWSADRYRLAIVSILFSRVRHADVIADLLDKALAK